MINSEKGVDILRRLLQIEGFLKFSLEADAFSVNKQRKSGIFIDVKKCWQYPWIIDQLSELMVQQSYGTDFVIGVETGGSPFAVKTASTLNIPFGLARKQSEFLKKAIAGYPDGLEVFAITIIDDVLGSGASLKRVLDNSSNSAKEYRLVTLLSYGMDKKLEALYPNLKVRSLFQVEELIAQLDRSKRAKAFDALHQYQEKLESMYE